MSTETSRVGYLPAPPGRRGAALLRRVSRLASRTAEFVDALLAAGTAAKQAQRYYDMSTTQLAEIGLTREQIPAVVLRALERDGR